MSMYIGVRSHAFRFFAVVLAVFLTVGFAGAASAAGEKEPKGPKGPNEDGGHTPVSICHYSDGAFHIVTPDNQGVANGHLKNHELDERVAADGTCPEVPPTDTGGGDPGDGSETPDEKVGICHFANGAYELLLVMPSEVVEHQTHGDVYPVPVGDDCTSLNAGDAVTICHATGSAAAPYQELTLPAAAADSHLKESGDFLLKEGSECSDGPGGSTENGDDVNICHLTDGADYDVLPVPADAVESHLAEHKDDFLLEGEECVKAPGVTPPVVTPPTTAVCHVKQNGKMKLRNVKNSQLDRHLAHGDTKAVDGRCFADEDGVPPVVTVPGTPGTTPPVVTPPKTPGKPGGGSDGGSTEGPGKPGADKPNKPGKPGAGSPNKPIVDGVEGERPAKGTKGDRPGNGPEPVKVSELVVVPAKENTSRVNRPGARVHRPAAKILPATGAGDNLGLLGATGLGMVLFGGLLLTGQRRPVRARR